MECDKDIPNYVCINYYLDLESNYLLMLFLSKDIYTYFIYVYYIINE